MSDFIQFATDHGLIVNHLPLGRIVRCPTETHRSSRNGAFFFDGLWGWVQDWSQSDQISVWKSDKVVDNADFRKKVKDSQAKYAQDKAKLNADAANKAQWILGQCELNISAYLSRKGFPEMCFNMLMEEGKDPLLCVPMRINGNLSGLQVIAPDGRKKFIYGTNASYASFDIGQGRQIFLVEGLASGLSLQKILNSLKITYMIKVCFSAGNMTKIAAAMPNSGPVIICDNDESGTGQKVGMDSRCRYYIPSVVGQDVNDECNQAGYFAVSQKIKKILYQAL